MSLQFGNTTVQFENSASFKDSLEVVTQVTNGANKGKLVKHATDGRKRRPNEWTSGFVVHTTSGTVWQRKKTLMRSVRDWVYALYQTNTDRSVSWHNTIDLDASMIQSADARFQCWHACQVNPFTDSCELIQTSDGSLTDKQLEYFAKFMNVWTYHTGIPPIIPWRNGEPYMGMLSRALSAHGAGRSLCCVYGHCNVWYATGKGGELKPYRSERDPSKFPFYALAEMGYLKMDVEKGEDLEYFKDLQKSLGIAQDGIWGIHSRRAFLNSGKSRIIKLPGDENLGVPAWSLIP